MNTAPNLDGLKLVSSNVTKIAEYRRLSRDTLPVQSGDDLREIVGTPDEIALYKALEAGPGLIVEDSILVVDGEPLIDIKWRLAELKERAKTQTATLSWETRLSYIKDGMVFVFFGEVSGHLRPYDIKGSGYDPIFNVEGVGQSLARLEQRGLKDLYSARARAFQNLLAHKLHLAKRVDELPVWTGDYQSE